MKGDVAGEKGSIKSKSMLGWYSRGVYICVQGFSLNGQRDSGQYVMNMRCMFTNIWHLRPCIVYQHNGKIQAPQSVLILK